jgi:uncharacterized Tic20 family protein
MSKSGYGLLVFVPTTIQAAEFLVLLMGWILAIFLGLLGLVIIWKVWKKDIDLSLLICDPDGKPSLARFQNLIFTIVIAMSFFLIVIETKKFPDIPNGVWVLLGISAGTFLGTKSIETSKAVRMKELEVKSQEL